MVKGTQSGGQVWDSAIVVRRGSIPGAHRIMFDSEMLPRRAAHAAGSRVWWYEMRRELGPRRLRRRVAVRVGRRGGTRNHTRGRRNLLAGRSGADPGTLLRGRIDRLGGGRRDG